MYVFYKVMFVYLVHSAWWVLDSIQCAMRKAMCLVDGV
jgi:hypothetical protein